MTFSEKIELMPIGLVRTEAERFEVKDKNRTSQIILDEGLADALEGISEYSHLLIIFWMHEITAEDRRMLKVHPRGREDLPIVGVFAVRSSRRPNPIGLTLTELVKVERNILTVRGLDAFDGTPVLDIKPFDPWDTAKSIKVPEWWLKLDEKRLETNLSTPLDTSRKGHL